MDLTLKVWRQAGPDAPGDFETAPEPTPYFSTASSAAVISLRCVVRPR